MSVGVQHHRCVLVHTVEGRTAYHCRCGWVSLQFDGPQNTALLFAVHAAAAHELEAQHPASATLASSSLPRWLSETAALS